VRGEAVIPMTTAKTSPEIEIHPQTALKAKFMSLRLYFLRHGETTASQTGGYCGTLDPERCRDRIWGHYVER